MSTDRGQVPDRLREQALQSDTLASLRGVEGAAGAVYWRSLRPLLGPYGFRVRSRDGQDVVDALLNYVSALLREAVLQHATSAGLDVQVSFLHEPYRGRPSLVFDLMEEWRPVLLESTVLALLGLRMVDASDVEHHPGGGVRLSDRARRAAVSRFDTRLQGRVSSADGRTGAWSSGCVSRWGGCARPCGPAGRAMSRSPGAEMPRVWLLAYDVSASGSRRRVAQQLLDVGLRGFAGSAPTLLAGGGPSW